MSLPKLILEQLANPAGLTGRLVLHRLNKANRGMNELPLRVVPISNTDHALEIGFGGGALLDKILSAGPSSVVGVETSDLAIRVVSSRYRHAIGRGKLKLVRSDAASMPFNDGAFSKIFCVNVIYFWPDVDQVFQELCRVTATSGQLAMCYQQRGPDQVISYNPSQVEQSLIDAGFTSAATTAGEDKWNDRFYCTVASKTVE